MYKTLIFPLVLLFNLIMKKKMTAELTRVVSLSRPK